MNHDFLNQEFGGNHALYFCRNLRTTHFVFAASSSNQQQNETQQTSSTSGATSPSTTNNGNKNQTNSGIVISGKDATLQNLDPEVSDSAFSAIVETVQNALQTVSNAFTQGQSGIAQAAQSTTDANAQTQEEQNALLQSVLSADQATAANAASGGQTNNNSTVVTVIIAAIAGFVLWLIFGKK